MGWDILTVRDSWSKGVRVGEDERLIDWNVQLDKGSPGITCAYLGGWGHSGTLTKLYRGSGNTGYVKGRLRVILLSLSPSRATRKKTARKKMAAQNPEGVLFRSSRGYFLASRHARWTKRGILSLIKIFTSLPAGGHFQEKFPVSLREAIEKGKTPFVLEIRLRVK